MGEADCCSRGLLLFLFPVEGFLRILLVADLHSQPLWTLCKWKRFDFLTRFIQGSKVCVLFTVAKPSTVQEALLMHFPDLVLRVKEILCLFWKMGSFYSFSTDKLFNLIIF